MVGLPWFDEHSPLRETDLREDRRQSRWREVVVAIGAGERTVEEGVEVRLKTKCSFEFELLFVSDAPPNRSDKQVNKHAL